MYAQLIIDHLKFLAPFLRNIELPKPIDTQVGHERIRQAHISRVSGQNQIPQLDTVGRYDIAHAVVVVAEELGEVVEQHGQVRLRRVDIRSADRGCFRLALASLGYYLGAEVRPPPGWSGY